jgi:hypothetical protein
LGGGGNWPNSTNFAIWALEPKQLEPQFFYMILKIPNKLSYHR